MKILVTGGAGFIGSHVVWAYVQAGYEVVVVDDLRTGCLKNLPAEVRLYRMDINSAKVSDVIELERPEIVSHHAAQTSVTVSVRDPVLDATINCCGLLNVLRGCVTNKIEHFVFVSSGGAIYGDVECMPTPERTRPKPRSPYGIHKYCGERYVEYFSSRVCATVYSLKVWKRVRPATGPLWRSRSGREIRRQATTGRTAYDKCVSRPSGRHESGLRICRRCCRGECSRCPGFGGGDVQHRFGDSCSDARTLE